MGTSPPSSPDSPPVPSSENPKLCRGIRIRASHYLQENLLGLPAPPTKETLEAIRAAKEKEAQERMREMERVREVLRQKEAARGAGVDSGTSNRAPSRGAVVPKFPPAGGNNTDAVDGTGWVGTAVTRESLTSEEDPFVVQREQLLSFIKQARQGGRQDEVDTLQASLREIERIMVEQRDGKGAVR